MTRIELNFKYLALALALGGLFVVLRFNLLVALFAACVTFALATKLPHTWLFRKAGRRSRIVASVVVAAVPVALVVVAGLTLAHLTANATTAYGQLMLELGRVIAQWREQLPAALAIYLPDGPQALKPWVSGILTHQSENLTGFGKSGAHGLLMAIIGVVVGLLLANGKGEPSLAPLSAALEQRAIRLQQTFSAIMIAQFWIAVINTAASCVFFFVVVPLTGAKMPYGFALLALTFFASLLPVAGNLLCNTITTLVALSVGPLVAVSALVFLVLIHKFEYIINAKVVGTQMSMAAWELLVAMFVLEAMFGIPGLVAAPFFYAYIKSELRDLGWVGSCHTDTGVNCKKKYSTPLIQL